MSSNVGLRHTLRLARSGKALFAVIIALGLLAGCASNYTPRTSSQKTVTIFQPESIQPTFYLRKDTAKTKKLDAKVITQGQQHSISTTVTRKQRTIKTKDKKVCYFTCKGWCPSGEGDYPTSNTKNCDNHKRNYFWRRVPQTKNVWLISSINHKLNYSKPKTTKERVKLNIYKDKQKLDINNEVTLKGHERFISTPSKQPTALSIRKYLGRDVSVLGKNALHMHKYAARISSHALSYDFDNHFNGLMKNRFKYFVKNTSFLGGNYKQETSTIPKDKKNIHKNNTVYWDSIEVKNPAKSFMHGSKMGYKDVRIVVIDSLSLTPVYGVNLVVSEINDDIFSKAYVQKMVNKKLSNKYLKQIVLSDLYRHTRSNGDESYGKSSTTSFRLKKQSAKFHIKTLHKKYVAVDADVRLRKNETEIIVKVNRIGEINRSARSLSKGSIQTH